MSTNDPLTPERWVNNLMEVANEIADRRMQEERWLTGEWNLWEHPEELIQTVDDFALDGFIKAFGSTFTTEQEHAILGFRDEYESFCAATPSHLDPFEVFSDARWERLRQRACVFVQTFVGKWPLPGSHTRATELLREWMAKYAQRNRKRSP